MTCVFLYKNTLYADSRVSLPKQLGEEDMNVPEESAVKDKIVKLANPIKSPNGGIFTHYSGTGNSVGLSGLRNHLKYIMDIHPCHPDKQLETIIKHLAAPLLRLDFDFVLVGYKGNETITLLINRRCLHSVRRGKPIKKVLIESANTDFVLGSGSSGIRQIRKNKPKHSAMDLMRSAYISSNGVNNEWTSLNPITQRKRYINFTITQKHVDDYNKLNAIQLKDVK